MRCIQLPATEDAVRRYVEDLWLPYHRDLEAAVDAHALADVADAELVDVETEFRLDLLDGDTHEVWVAVDAPVVDAPGNDAPAKDIANTDFADLDATLAGYVTTEVDDCPEVFDRPDRLVVGDIWVRDDHRGSGVGRELIDVAADRADHYDCEELRLDVDVDNERALAFYETLGFEPHRYQMTLDVDAL